MIKIELDFVLDDIKEIELAQMLNDCKILIVEVLDLNDPNSDLTLLLTGEIDNFIEYMLNFYGVYDKEEALELINLGKYD